LLGQTDERINLKMPLPPQNLGQILAIDKFLGKIKQVLARKRSCSQIYRTRFDNIRRSALPHYFRLSPCSQNSIVSIRSARVEVIGQQCDFEGKYVLSKTDSVDKLLTAGTDTANIGTPGDQSADFRLTNCWERHDQRIHRRVWRLASPSHLTNADGISLRSHTAVRWKTKSLGLPMSPEKRPFPPLTPLTPEISRRHFAEYFPLPAHTIPISLQ